MLVFAHVFTTFKFFELFCFAFVNRPRIIQFMFPLHAIIIHSSSSNILFLFGFSILFIRLLFRPWFVHYIIATCSLFVFDFTLELEAFKIEKKTKNEYIVNDRLEYVARTRSNIRRSSYQIVLHIIIE